MGNSFSLFSSSDSDKLSSSPLVSDELMDDISLLVLSFEGDGKDKESVRRACFIGVLCLSCFIVPPSNSSENHKKMLIRGWNEVKN
jgi:hypothetical protein